MTMFLYPSNDNLLIAQGLSTINQDGQTVFLTSTATVQVTLRIANDLVKGENWPIALVYIAGSKGDFQGNLRNELVLPVSGTAIAQLVIDNGADQHGEIFLDLIIQTRKA